VYLFDYDAVEPLTEIKIRTNQERVDGEEGVPYWYYEDGVTFLPEEIEIGLGITDKSLRLLFGNVHGDLMTTEYWERIQNDLRQERVPPLHLYPDACRLRRNLSGPATGLG
jgi:isocitrate dehydrogenase kinase/phosphatase